MQAISPQEVVANSPKLSARLTMVGLDVSGMREIVYIELEYRKTYLLRLVAAPEISVRMNLDECLLAKSPIELNFCSAPDVPSRPLGPTASTSSTVPPAPTTPES
jgi:hypothetical protein